VTHNEPIKCKTWYIRHLPTKYLFWDIQVQPQLYQMPQGKIPLLDWVHDDELGKYPWDGALAGVFPLNGICAGTSQVIRKGEVYQMKPDERAIHYVRTPMNRILLLNQAWLLYKQQLKYPFIVAGRMYLKNRSKLRIMTRAPGLEKRMPGNMMNQGILCEISSARMTLKTLKYGDEGSEESKPIGNFKGYQLRIIDRGPSCPIIFESQGIGNDGFADNIVFRIELQVGFPQGELFPSNHLGIIGDGAILLDRLLVVHGGIVINMERAMKLAEMSQRYNRENHQMFYGGLAELRYLFRMGVHPNRSHCPNTQALMTYRCKNLVRWDIKDLVWLWNLGFPERKKRRKSTRKSSQDTLQLKAKHRTTRSQTHFMKPAELVKKSKKLKSASLRRKPKFSLRER